MKTLKAGPALFDELLDIILLQDPGEKCTRTAALHHGFSENPPNGQIDVDCGTNAIDIPVPGIPPSVKLVAPRDLQKRGMQKPEGRMALMHAVAHIEFNAINLALDAAYRFRGLPVEYYGDWIRVAADEARHFQMVHSYLVENGSHYGDFPAHNGLWDMAQRTAHDVIARMAMVPRVMEARGLDVTPAMINKLEHNGDQPAADILCVIYEEEIEHVHIGSRWYRHACQSRNIDPDSHFPKLVASHMHGSIRGPLNLSARRQAGFSEEELAAIEPADG